MKKCIVCGLSIVWFAIQVTGCGFHLRGMINLPQWLDSVYIESPVQHSALKNRLINQLEDYNVQVSHTPAYANYWLTIESEQFQQQIASISSSTTPRQYQLIYNVSFKLIDAKGKELIASRQIVVSRQITINNDRILGSDYEESITKNEMRREAASLILSRISKLQIHMSTQHKNR